MFPKEIICIDESSMEDAQRCSQLLKIPIRLSASQAHYLVFENNTVSVVSKQKKQTLNFNHSFFSKDLQRRTQTQDQHLLKAFKDKQSPISTILDVTAGWCRDSFILAQNQYHVTAIEQSDLIYFMTQFSLQYYLKQQSLNLTLHHSHALDYVSHLTSFPDAIYLDPMFPSSKQQAKNKKEIQLLQSVTHNSDIDALFQLALETATQRVVVKRPLHSDFLIQQKPSFQFKGKTIRFDVYQC